ncbi:MAG TPA: DNA mismatch repair endonuclease MutL [Ruminiclostridium sp.]|nr:DNA mismatch repair endonuclease MutL [Ruminiclostridium sp.]
MSGESVKRIHVLDKKVAELIAAGEVVERPASAVKELLENSIDAGATMITLEIKNGGITFIRITDNGCGIMREDVSSAFLRHATSKILKEDDLNCIGTLGFRGEALASIAAVSKTELITRTEDELAGTHIKLEGGEVIETGDAGCPVGTTIIIRELFFNTPARMKFLKKDTTEGNAVAAIAQRIALSHPEVSLRFIKDGREEIHTPGDNRLISAIHSVLGREFSQSLIKADYTLDRLKSHGFVTKPLAARTNRNMQFFFLNGRFVKSRTMMAALEEAYKNSIMTGKYPGCVLNLEINPSLVDVNVHPAKLEVRFTNEHEVFETVYYTVKNALAQSDTRPKFEIEEKTKQKIPDYSFNPHKSGFESHSGQKEEQLKIVLQNTPHVQETEKFMPVCNNTRAAYEPVPGGRFYCKSETSGEAEETVQKPDDISENNETTIIEPKADNTAEIKKAETVGSTKAFVPAPAFSTSENDNIKVVGQCFGTYILAQKADSLWIIDKHAAHERILYEQVKKLRSASSQVLLEPVAVALPAEEYAAAVDNLDLLGESGIAAEDFGGSTILVREAPLDLAGQDIPALVSEIAGLLCAHKKDLTPARLDWIFHSVACRAAIKAHDRTTLPEMQSLCERILCDNDILYCPHGRPVAYELPRGDIEKKFGR